METIRSDRSREETELEDVGGVSRRSAGDELVNDRGEDSEYGTSKLDERSTSRRTGDVWRPVLESVRQLRRGLLTFWATVNIVLASAMWVTVFRLRRLVWVSVARRTDLGHFSVRAGRTWSVGHHPVHFNISEVALASPASGEKGASRKSVWPYTLLAGVSLLAVGYCVAGYAMTASFAAASQDSSNYVRVAILWATGIVLSLITSVGSAAVTWRRLTRSRAQRSQSHSSRSA